VIAPRYDVVVVGASIAGATAATLYARNGANVALLERHSDAAAYKVLCNHSIQAGALPVIRELGLQDGLDAAGALRNNSVSWWTRWGWIEPGHDGDTPYGYNVRRSTLDPMLRDLAAGTPGVDLVTGASVTGLLRDDAGRVTGVSYRHRGREHDVRAALVVGADGRNSSVAKHAEVAEKRVDNGRFSYFAYFTGAVLARPDTCFIWFGEDMAYANPNDGDVTVITCAPGKKHLPAFRDDLEGAYHDYLARLPDGPDLSGAERVSKIIGTTDYPLIQRAPVAPGVALVGDAALCSDPVWGIGCGWAFQTAHWLVDSTHAALGEARGLDRALARYRRRRTMRLAAQQFLIADYAGGRAFNAIERQMFAAATRDDRMARHVHRYGSRTMGVHEFLAPSVLARAVGVNLTHRLRERAVPVHPRAHLERL
jgi:flavin-dependent dehydrogenase